MEAGLIRALLLVCCTAIGISTARAAEPLIAAASDLKFAMEEIASSFQKERGQAVKLTFGSSGTFATQIRDGAPFDLYLSADEDYVRTLAAEGLTRDDGALYAIGRIVLMVPQNSSLPVDGELRGLGLALNAGRIARFAIANPEHAPKITGLRH